MTEGCSLQPFLFVRRWRGAVEPLWAGERIHFATSMLERVRRNRSFAALVTAVFALLLLTAALSGVRVRTGLGIEAAWADVCSTSHAAGEPASWPGAPDEDMGHGAHSPDCVLCIALAPPESLKADIHRPPVPAFHQKWRSLPALLAMLDVAAPLPARGPPGAAA
jgi:hypothetical protein